MSGAQSKISGVADAIKLNNLGLGETSIVVGGEVESSNGIGVNISAGNADNNENLTFTTATNSGIIAKEAGVSIVNRGADVAVLDIRGDVIAQGEAAFMLIAPRALTSRCKMELGLLEIAQLLIIKIV